MHFPVNASNLYSPPSCWPHRKRDFFSCSGIREKGPSKGDSTHTGMHSSFGTFSTSVSLNSLNATRLRRKPRWRRGWRGHKLIRVLTPGETTSDDRMGKWPASLEDPTYCHQTHTRWIKEEGRNGWSRGGNTHPSNNQIKIVVVFVYNTTWDESPIVRHSLVSQRENECTHPYAQSPEKWGQLYTFLLGPPHVTCFYCRIGNRKIILIFFVLTIFSHLIWSQSCKNRHPAQGYWGQPQ